MTDTHDLAPAAPVASVASVAAAPAAEAPVPGRRRVLKAAVAAAAASALPFPAIAQGAKVRYTLSWLPTGQYAFVYMARQLGFWKKRGIEVDIARGFGSMGAIQGVAGDKFDMGGAATGAIAISVMRGLDLEIVGTQGYDSFMGILAPSNGPIKSPKDLVGKKVGVTAAGGDTPFLPAYCKLAGIDFGSLNVVALDSQIIEQSVINGQVDCMVAFGMSSIPNFITQNFPVTLFKFSDVGLNFYWVNTMARGDFYKKNPQLVADVQEGLMEGMKWTMLNPEEAVERHLKEHPEIALGKSGKLFTELGVGMIAVCNTVPETARYGVGYTDLRSLDQQAKLVRQYTGKPEDPAPPPAERYAVNFKTGAVMLTPAEWQTVQAKTGKYAKLLAKG
jgi:ABC-type nitrate/sulfonate/bicarbonate transport system substrate-binding protein